MKIDREKLRALLSMPDDELWREISTIAGGYGFTLPKNAPPKSEMDKLRGAVKDGERLNLAQAIKIINTYRKEQK